MKQVGDTIFWKDVNGREHCGEVVKVCFTVYRIKTPDGLVYSISKRPEDE